MSSSRPSAISARVLPTPEKMIRSAGTPAARARQQFALRDDVHPGARARERRQHRLVGIGLHRIADERGDSRRPPRRRGNGVRSSRWSSNRRACRPRARCARGHVFGEQGAVTIGENGAWRALRAADRGRTTTWARRSPCPCCGTGVDPRDCSKSFEPRSGPAATSGSPRRPQADAANPSAATKTIVKARRAGLHRVVGITAETPNRRPHYTRKRWGCERLASRV